MLAPAAVAWLAGMSEAAPLLALGTVLAIQLGVLARPAAAFAMLLPFLYLAAAVTAYTTDAVVTLVAAIAAAVGASASLGLQRGLFALFAAALLGSFSPGETDAALTESGWLLAGSTYGWIVSSTWLRRVRLPTPRLDGRAATGYALLLACVTLCAWFFARAGGFAHSWWLPAAVVAVSEPSAEPGAARAVLRMLLATSAAMVLVFVTDVFETPASRAVLALPMLAAAVAATRRRPHLAAVCVAPLLLLLSGQPASREPPLDYLLDCLAAFVPAVTVASIGHWLLWASRPAPPRIASGAEPGSA
jgi:hypothetical protein